MDQKLMKEIIKTRNAIRKKYKALKTGRIETEAHLEETFKPITGPLKELVTKVKLEPQDTVKPEPKEEDYSEITMTPLKQKYLKLEPTSTPSTSRDYYLSEDEDQFATPTHSSTLERAASLPDISSSVKLISPYLALHINDSTKIDKSSGIYFDGFNWKIGNSVVIFGENNIAIKGKTYNATEGLLELLFMKKPHKKLITEEDLKHYGTILRDTSAHKRDYEEDGQIKGSGGYKYKKIISKLIHREGKGLMHIPKENVDYIYWDDPNELVNRLRLLTASQHAGNNSHNNEIVSIIEELREADIIV